MPTKVAQDTSRDLDEVRAAGGPVVLDTRVVTGTGGGPEKTILNSPRYLVRKGYKMLCAYMHPPGDPGYAELRRRAADLGAPLISIPDCGALDPRVLKELLILCRRERVAIWHGHDYKSNVLGLILRRMWPMRLVTTCHGWVRHTRRTPVYYALDRMSLRRYERVLCVSQDLVEDCRRAGVKADRCVLLENGIDTEDFRRSRGIAEAKRLLGVPTDRVLIGAAGRLSREKGFETLILAADALIRAGQNVELRIAGEGDQAAKLDRVIRSLGRSSRIRLLGYQADLRTFYEALDLFALSSVREGLPNVLLEALAYEIPVVATAVNGIPSLVDRHRCGLLVEPGSAKALAAGLAALIAEPGRRHELGRRGRLAAETQYSFATRMDVVSGIYDDLLNGERS